MVYKILQSENPLYYKSHLLKKYNLNKKNNLLIKQNKDFINIFLIINEFILYIFSLYNYKILNYSIFFTFLI